MCGKAKFDQKYAAKFYIRTYDQKFLFYTFVFYKISLKFIDKIIRFKDGDGTTECWGKYPEIFYGYF